MMRPAAIYARVSSDRQKEDHTIASQTQAVMDYATAHGYLVPPDWIFEDEGVSGAVLVRPALEAVRDLAAQGQIEAVLVHSPDRLSRKYAYQVLLIEEFARIAEQLVRAITVAVLVLDPVLSHEPPETSTRRDAGAVRAVHLESQVARQAVHVRQQRGYELAREGDQPADLSSARLDSLRPAFDEEGHLTILADVGGQLA